MSGDGFPEWKLTEKRLSEVERQQLSQAQELSRLRNLAQSTRDDMGQLKTALLGNATLGMDGLLERLERLEDRLTRVWWLFVAVLGIGAMLNIITLYFLFRLLELYGG